MNSLKTKKSSIIKLKNITKSFENLEVLKDISIDVYEDEFITILGPSGCGKSTIFNIISKILPFDSGELEVNSSLGYMQQKDLLLPWKTIIENISLPLELEGVSKENRQSKVKEYLPVIGLEGYENSYPSQLSGGMKQRASFLRTLMAAEEIMLLDEPFASLDSITRSNMQEWLLEMKESLGITILLITHDIDEALLLSDRIYVLSKKPSVVKKEFNINCHKNNKLERKFSKEILDIKKEIIGLL